MVSIAKAVKEDSKAAGHHVFLSEQIFRQRCLSKVNLHHWNSPFRDPFKIQTSLHSLAVFELKLLLKGERKAKTPFLKSRSYEST